MRFYLCNMEHIADRSIFVVQTQYLLQPLIMFQFLGVGEENPASIAYRTWLLISMLATMILHVHYTAFLISIFSLTDTTLPFTGIRGLYDKRSEWTLSIIKASSHEELLKVQTEFLKARIKGSLNCIRRS